MLRLVKCAEYKASVGAPETERVGQGQSYLSIPGHVGDVVQITLGILVLEVAGRRHDLVVNGLHAEYAFGDTRRTVQDKLMASKIVTPTVAETLFGRTGLNGVFKITSTNGEKSALIKPILRNFLNK